MKPWARGRGCSGRSTRMENAVRATISSLDIASEIRVEYWAEVRYQKQLHSIRIGIDPARVTEADIHASFLARYAALYGAGALLPGVDVRLLRVGVDGIGVIEKAEFPLLSGTQQTACGSGDPRCLLASCECAAGNGDLGWHGDRPRHRGGWAGADRVPRDNCGRAERRAGNRRSIRQPRHRAGGARMSPVQPDPVTFEVIWHRLARYRRGDGHQVHADLWFARSRRRLRRFDRDHAARWTACCDGSVHHDPGPRLQRLIVEATVRLRSGDPGIHPGDMFICNDPYLGATHQPDVATVAPLSVGDAAVVGLGGLLGPLARYRWVRTGRLRRVSDLACSTKGCGCRQRSSWMVASSARTSCN